MLGSAMYHVSKLYYAHIHLKLVLVLTSIKFSVEKKFICLIVYRDYLSLESKMVTIS